MLKILCLIPARSGSKGIVHKNIKSYRGLPLIGWSIQHAKKCKFPMKIVVSTDSEQYADIARKLGAEVPFLRPAEISGDLSTDFEFIKHALDMLKKNENYIPDIVVQLRPTYPTRKVEDLNRCLEIFINERKNGFNSLRTVVPFDKSPFKMYTINQNNKQLKPLFENIDGKLNQPYNRCRQELPPTFLHNGCIDILNTNIVYENKSITGNKIFAYVMEKNEIRDIDYIKDWI